MYVQEYGSECPLPNRRHVCISYIDSVKYFRPEIKAATGEALRTFVYHEILLGYLDYCKKRGFTSCYIWSCPSMKQDDYIIYCHPKTQKIPKPSQLCQWYQTLISKAIKENIIVEHSNLYDHYIKPSRDCKARVTAAWLPYFDGDYWPGEAEVVLQQRDDNVHQKNRKKAVNERAQRAAARRDDLSGNPKDNLQKIGDILKPKKKEFIIVHFQHTCKHCYKPILSGNRWVCNVRENYHLCEKCYYTEQNLEKDIHTISAREKHSYHRVEVEAVPADTNDEDEIIQNEFFDTRDQFLTLCQRNCYQFDTLRRAKHSTMMILYYLHNPIMSSCAVCHDDIDTAHSLYCKTCTNYVVCDSCYQREGAVWHDHELVRHSTMADCDLLPNSRTQEKQALQVYLEPLLHVSNCAVHSCTSPFCSKLKRVFQHGVKCTTRWSGGCKICKKMWAILKLHACSCEALECRVPRCKKLKDCIRSLKDCKRKD